MAAGYVYILINKSLDMIKIGRTTRDSRGRARELSKATGVPTPFELAYEVFSENHEIVEKTLHEKLSNFRVNDKREFFKYPLKESIDLLIEHSQPPKEENLSFCSMSIFSKLQEKYKQWLKPGIVDVQIVQTDGRVWLEITKETFKAGSLKDQNITRTDLGFIVDEIAIGSTPELFFDPKNNVRVNSEKFLSDFDPYSIIMTTDLFHKAACEEIDEKHRESQRKKK